MKKIYFLSIILVVACLACSDFLKESSNDQIIPKTVKDYSEFIFGEVYRGQNSSAFHTYLDIMTDDCTDFRHTRDGLLSSDNRVNGWGYWTWQQKPEMPWEGVLNSDPAWGYYYHQILMTNITLAALDDPDIMGGEEETAFLRAECHLIRAYAYFMLVNLYGEPYLDEPDKAMGVPINDLVGAHNQTFTRASVAEVYDVIRDNLDKAFAALRIGPGDGSIFRWNYRAACLFASRVALYTRRWEEAVRYAGEVIVQGTELWNLEAKRDAFLDARFFCADNPEILFSYGYYSNSYFASGAVGVFQASEALRDLYENGDLRYNTATTAANSKGAFMRLQGSTSTLTGTGLKTLPYKNTTSSTTNRHASALRVAEAYLNRAEANANIPGNEALALNDLNSLREYRFTAVTFAPLTAGSGNVMQLVREERRRELCFEQHRWFDLRRWDRPRIVHTFQPDKAAGSPVHTYVLEQDDPAYTLPAPSAVIDLDPGMGNPTRPEREQL
jgi:hypothetical protein